MKTKKIKTANGKMEIHPVCCEWTGKQIGWKTEPPEGCTPAYFSFEVVNEHGTTVDPTVIELTTV